MTLVGTIVAAVALVAPGQQTGGDLARMQGTWRAITDSGTTILLNVQGDRCQIEASGPDGKPLKVKAVLKLDEKASPKTFDWSDATRDDGQAMPDLKAIYELDGDTLRVCGGEPGAPRPTRFENVDDGPTLTVLRRVRGPKVEPAPTGDLARMQGTWRAMSSDRGSALVLTVKGAEYRVKTIGPDGDPIVVTGRLELDEKASPKAWNGVQRTQSDGRPMPDLLGIYELDGDTLRVCNNGPGKPRPTEFREGEDGLPVITTFARVKDQP
jgi:uncharacterized protein (TIGR03067 family)